MIGPKNLGAIQVLSVEEKKGKGKKATTQTEIRLLQTALFKDSEVHDLVVTNEKDHPRLLIAGQTNDPEFKTPSFLEILPLEGGLIQEKATARIDLPSYAATAVLHAHDSIFVAVGDKDGGIVHFGELHTLRAKNHALKDIDHQFYPLEDARNLAANSHSVYAISGGQASIWSKRIKGEGLRGKSPYSTSLAGGLLPEAKSTIQVSQNVAYIGLGDGGAQIVELNQFEKVGEIPAMSHREMDERLSITNAVLFDGRELITGDGEAGSRIFEMRNTRVIEQTGHLSFGKKTSVNAISKEDDLFAFAVGLGGLKIVKRFD